MVQGKAEGENLSRRDAIIKATAGALNPKGLDLTKYRQRSLTERTRSIRAMDAAAALGFAARDWQDEYGEHHGDPLAPALLRVKYAEHRDRSSFSRAHLLLLHRHVGEADISETMYAVAFAAIFEWVADDCPTCRQSRHGTRPPQPCPACRPTVDSHGEPVARARRVTAAGEDREARIPGADPYCPKCLGVGRIFRPAKAGRGMLCADCGNSGRRSFTVKERWKLVSDYLRTAQEARDERPRGMDLKVFVKSWLRVYDQLLNVLRAADKKIVVGVDMQISRYENADIVPAPVLIEVPNDSTPDAQEEKQYQLGDEPTDQ